LIEKTVAQYPHRSALCRDRFEIAIVFGGNTEQTTPDVA